MMNTKILLLVLIMLSWGCSDFLEESSQDEIRPSTVGDMEQILLGDGYTNDEYNFYFITEVFTDNVQNNGVGDYSMQEDHNKWKWCYTWDKNMFTEAGGGHNSNVWQAPYEGILGCNLVLDYIDEMYGEHNLRESVKGEALVLRAWYYLHLVNFFGIAYNQGNPHENLGVPLKLETAVTGDFFNRNTVAEVYEQIEKDLLEGDRLLTEYDFDRNFFRIGHLAAKAILSRVYLYMEDWDKALKYADLVLQARPELLDLNSLGWKTASIYTWRGVCDPDTPDEIIWMRLSAKPNIAIATLYPMSISPYGISDNLSGSYEKGTMADYVARTILDLRARTYFCWKTFMFSAIPASSPHRAFTLKNSMENICYQGIRSSELYLNRAEAYAQKYLKEGNDSYRQAALDNLNTLRRKRYNSEFTYNELNITDGEELLEFCIAERRRELVGETNHRWCDLRRYGMTVSHTLIEDGSTEYTQDMSYYVLPIPDEIIRLNPYLKQN